MNWDPSQRQRKALFAAIVVVLAAVGVYLTAPELFGSDDDRQPGRRLGAPSPRATGSSDTGIAGESVSPGPTGSDSPLPTRQPYKDVVLRFVREFTRTDRATEKWHAAVSRFATPALAKSLSYTNPANVPEGSPTGDSKIVAVDENAVQVAVPLDSGEVIVVTVVSTEDGYAVSAVRPGERG